MDDRPAGSQPPPQNQPPQNYQPQQQPYQPQPQPQTYQPQPQQQQQQQRPGPGMPNMANMADMGKGNPYLMNPDIRLNSIERMTVMLMRLVAWISLVLLVITICVDGIQYLSGGGITFSNFMGEGSNLLGRFATGALAAVTLLGLASVVESLIAMRQNNKS